jgi:cytochrome c-type biogenesis protein CcmH
VTAFAILAGLLAAAAIALLAWPLARPRGTAPSRPPGRIAAALVAILLPVAAVLVYAVASNWDWDAPPPPALTAPDLERVVAELRRKLAEQPDDIEGWKLLGRSATVLGDYVQARDAFGEANARTGGRDAEAIVGYAESLVLIDEREIDGQAAQLFEQALALAPDNPRALWYGGITAYRRGDLALARQRWVELQDFDLPPDLRQVLAERLAALGPTDDGSPTPADESNAPAGVELTITLDPALEARVVPGATLFVIARRGEGGPPLAVQRRLASGWPVRVRLSDADAMLPGISLAGSGPLTLIARVSASGQPVAASGDLFGEVGYDFAAARPANITIDRVVP